MRAKKRVFLKKGDCIVLAAVAVSAFALLLCSKLVYPAVTDGIARITVNGELYGAYSLQEDRELHITHPDGGSNTVVFENGAVRVSAADCPDQLCVKQGSIDRRGQTVVCLPHGLVITVKNASAADVDIMI